MGQRRDSIVKDCRYGGRKQLREIDRAYCPEETIASHEIFAVTDEPEEPFCQAETGELFEVLHHSKKDPYFHVTAGTIA